MLPAPFLPRLLVTLVWTIAVALSKSSVAGGGAAPNCTWIPATDCTGLVTPPGFLRDWGIATAAQKRCCDLCQNHTECSTAVLALDQGGVCMLKPADTTCSHGHANRLRLQPSGKPGPAHNNVPNWTVTYNMSESTVVMPCNYSGLYDFTAYPELAKFGLVDYDWSNAKMVRVWSMSLFCGYLTWAARFD